MEIGTAVVILVAAVVLAGGLVGAALLFSRRMAAGAAQVQRPSIAGGSPGALATSPDAAEQRTELARVEERLIARTEKLDLRLAEIEERERIVAGKEAAIDELREDRIRKLEAVSGMSPGAAKQALLGDLEDSLRHDSARLVRQIEQVW